MFRSLRKLTSDQSGSATVEFCIWVMPFCALLMFTVDVSMLYLNMTKMENAARDGARRISVGQFDTTEIGPIVKAQLTGGSYSVTADCSTQDFACVTVSKPVSEMTAFGVYLKPIIGDTFSSQTRMRLEPGVSISLSNGMPVS